MATCSECGVDIEVDEFDIERNDLVSCHECGVTLAVTKVSPPVLELADETGMSGPEIFGDDGDDGDRD